MFHSTRMGESEIVRKKKSRYFERDLFVEKLSKKISKLPFFFNLILMKSKCTELFVPFTCPDSSN